MAPIHTVSVREAELDKYRELWTSVPDYRDVSPGESLLGPFLTLSGLQPGTRVVDVGCGTGRAAIKLAQLLMDVTLVDGTRHALDPDAADLPFVEACLWDDWPAAIGPQDVAYCCDVLEHIPVEFSMLTVARCLQAAPFVFLHISNSPDAFGASIGRPLHVNVQSFTWWRDRLAELGELVDARDLIGHALYALRRRS